MSNQKKLVRSFWVDVSGNRETSNRRKKKKYKFSVVAGRKQTTSRRKKKNKFSVADGRQNKTIIKNRKYWQLVELGYTRALLPKSLSSVHKHRNNYKFGALLCSVTVTL